MVEMLGVIWFILFVVGSVQMARRKGRSQIWAVLSLFIPPFLLVLTCLPGLRQGTRIRGTEILASVSAMAFTVWIGLNVLASSIADSAPPITPVTTVPTKPSVTESTISPEPNPALQRWRKATACADIVPVVPSEIVHACADGNAVACIKFQAIQEEGPKFMKKCMGEN